MTNLLKIYVPLRRKNNLKSSGKIIILLNSEMKAKLTERGLICHIVEWQSLNLLKIK